MKKLAFDMPVKNLNKIAVGDEVINEYESQGKVVKITKNINQGIIEFHFALDSKQVIYIMGNAI